MAIDAITLAASKKYTNDTCNGLGYLKGASCRIEKIERTVGDDGNIVTFAWTDLEGNVQTSIMVVMDGKDLQVNTLPLPQEKNLGLVIQYTGPTISNYKHNYFYECVYDDISQSYKWKNAKVQDSDGGSGGTVDITVSGENLIFNVP